MIEFNKILKISSSILIIILQLSILASITSCKKELEESEDKEKGEFVILKKDQPVIQKKILKYSYPPMVKPGDITQYSPEDIDKMARELDMEGFRQGDKLYYKNSKHMIFNPEQIPTIYMHKEEYFEEINNLW